MCRPPCDDEHEEGQEDDEGEKWGSERSDGQGEGGRWCGAKTRDNDRVDNEVIDMLRRGSEKAREMTHLRRGLYDGRSR